MALTITFATEAAAGSPVEKGIDIADFFGSVRTAGGGYFHVTGGRPDTLRDRFSVEGRPKAMSWRIDVADGAPSRGLALVIPPFAEDSGTKQAGVASSASAVRFLEIQLIGQLRQRTIRIDVAPSPGNGSRKAIGAIAPGQIDSLAWRVVRVPIPAGLGGLHRGPVRLGFEGGGSAWVAIQRMKWCATDQSGRWRDARPKPMPRRKVTWVWETDAILIDPAKQKELIAFCQDQSITDLFFECPYNYENGELQLRHVAAQRAMNRAAHRAGIYMHALDGAVRYVLPKHHERMFRLVDALERFNRAGSADQRYPALHLDNEPYQRPEWASALTRQKVIDDYLRLNRELRRRTAAAGLVFGVDIPFWWDLRNRDGNPEFSAKVDGRTVSLAEAIIQCVQNVGVMAYRDRVIGPDGVMALCREEFRLGRRYGVDVFAAVEVGTQAEVEEGTTLGVFPRQYVEDQLETLQHAVGFEPGCSGMAIHYYEAYSRLPA